MLLQAWEPDPENPNHYTTVLQDVPRVAPHAGAQRVVADQGEGAHHMERVAEGRRAGDAVRRTMRPGVGLAPAERDG